MITEYERWEQKERMRENIKEFVLTLGAVLCLVGAAVVWIFAEGVAG